MKNVVITIGREYGSGGRKLGKLLSDRLNIDFYDAATLREKARDVGLESGIFDMFDEQPTRSFLFSIVMDPTTIENALNEGKVLEAQCKVINDAADKGSCVIVGRRADKVLEERQSLLSIFISADLEDRIEYVSKTEQLNPKASKKLIERKDRERASYYNYFGDGKWGKANNYDMCFNLSKIPMENVVDIIENYINNR